MSEQQQHNLDELDDLKPDQFSLRGIMIATAIVAVTLAVFGPWLRQFSETRIALLAGASSVGVVLWWALLCLRARDIRGAGETLLVVPRQTDWRHWALRYVVVVACALSGAWFVHNFLHTNKSRVNPMADDIIALMTVASSVFGVLMVATLKVPRHFVLCENMYVVGMSPVSWRGVHRDLWHHDQNGLWLGFVHATGGY